MHGSGSDGEGHGIPDKIWSGACLSCGVFSAVMSALTVVFCGESFEPLAGAFEAARIPIVRTDREGRELGDVPTTGLSAILLDTAQLGEELAPVIERLAREPGFRVIVTGVELESERIVDAMRSGATDVLDWKTLGAAEFVSRIALLPEIVPGANRTSDDEILRLRKFLHDVKNPINNILGYSELLLENPTTKIEGEGAHFVDRMRVNCMQALDIIKVFADEVVRNR